MKVLVIPQRNVTKLCSPTAFKLLLLLFFDFIAFKVWFKWNLVRLDSNSNKDLFTVLKPQT